MVEELNQILNMDMEGTPEKEGMPEGDMPTGNDEDGMKTGEMPSSPDAASSE